MVAKIEVKDGVAIATHGDLVMFLWKEPATLERCRACRPSLLEMAERFPNGFIWLNIILSTSSPPDRRARAEISQNVVKVRPHLRKLVAVPLGDSVWHSVVRALIRSMSLLSGLSKLQVVTSTVAEALAQIRLAAGPATPPAEELAATVQSLYAALSVDPARAA